MQLATYMFSVAVCVVSLVFLGSGLSEVSEAGPILSEPLKEFRLSFEARKHCMLEDGREGFFANQPAYVVIAQTNSGMK